MRELNVPITRNPGREGGPMGFRHSEFGMTPIGDDGFPIIDDDHPAVDDREPAALERFLTLDITATHTTDTEID
ncbi:hypothetical protein ACFXG4_08420 [Nocardia sp. NPDC059246]|uniref:hypothetical protein n=1 Tax=unclassified Nocardia TaxID=2637762 RepID=UPI0036A9CBDA